MQAKRQPVTPATLRTDQPWMLTQDAIKCQDVFSATPAENRLF